jgi:hypothetical protein
MKVWRGFAGREGWRLRGEGQPIRVGVKRGATPLSGPRRHRTMAEYFAEQKRQKEKGQR